MLDRFVNFIQQQHLFPQGEEVLLAVSGGRDSVCMAHLFHRAGFRFSIAHCNFHLRPGDCDRDEAFVRSLADSYGVPCHVEHFDTRAVAAASGESVEETARRLRYGYFAQLSPVVATAHHRDDSIETFFLNLFRGTGISGLHGIRPVSELSIGNLELKILRPLLPFGRVDIDAYVAENRLEFVEDHTNALLDARRNQIRHRLMPLLRELYPSVDTTMAANIEILHDTELIYKDYLESLRSQLITPYRPSPLTGNNGKLTIDSVNLPLLRSWFPFPNIQFSILFELLHPYGFNASTVADILNASENGKMFYSSTHVAELHGGQILMAAKDEPGPGRHPQHGDRIALKKSGNQASGQSKLLSDYLKDLGLSRIERRHVLLCVNADGFVEPITGGQPGRPVHGGK